MITTLAAPEAVNARALIIFAKKPLPGAVKTRLTPPLTPQEAAVLYSCMLHDTLEMTRSLGSVTPFIFFQNDPGAAEYFEITFPGILSRPQAGENLGARMKSAFAELFSRGFAQVAIIGTDSPDLPREHIYEAFALIERKKIDVVFGPTEDGGYYLLALKRVWGELFTGLPWSSAELLAASVSRAKELCLGRAFLPVWYDIDTAADLKRPGLLDKKSLAIRTRMFLISGHQPDNQHPSDV